MCLKFRSTAKKNPLASLSPYIDLVSIWSEPILNIHITSHKNGPQQDSEEKPIVLEVYVIYDEEPRVEEQGHRDDSLNGWINSTSHEPAQVSRTQNYSTLPD